jgi:hypothetical protein
MHLLTAGCWESRGAFFVVVVRCLCVVNRKGAHNILLLLIDGDTE